MYPEGSWAICERCCFLYRLSDLTWQFDFRGQRLENLRILVCNRCLDVPQEQFRPVVVPPDPVPTRNPRPDQYRLAIPYIVTDTAGAEVGDTTNGLVCPLPAPAPAISLSYVTAPKGAAGNVDSSPTNWVPPDGYPQPLSNRLMYDPIFDVRGVLVRDTRNGQVSGAALTQSASGVTSAQQMDGYMLRATNGGPVLRIPD